MNLSLFVFVILAAIAFPIAMRFVDDVTYVDRSGETISTSCKTSLFTGVYWAEGRRVSEPPPRIISRHLCAKCG